MSDVGTYLRVFDKHEGIFAVVADDEPRVDAAVEQWISSGRTNDTILHLTTTEGEACCLLASTLTGWIVSTPEGRRRGIEIEAAFRDERNENRRLVGLPWDEEES